MVLSIDTAISFIKKTHTPLIIRRIIKNLSVDLMIKLNYDAKIKFSSK